MKLFHSGKLSFFLSAVLFLGGLSALPAAAQNNSPYNAASSSVQIDKSVLDNLGKAPSQSYGYEDYDGHNGYQSYGHANEDTQRNLKYRQYQPAYNPPSYDNRPIRLREPARNKITLKPPPGVPVLPAPSSRDVSSYKEIKEATRPYKPTLTAPAQKPRESHTSEFQSRGENSGLAIEWNSPRISSEVQDESGPQVQVPVPENTAVAYPVKVKEKTNSFQSIAEFEADQEEKRQQRNANRKAGNNVPAVVAKNVPVPPKRPSIKKASISFVNEARQERDMAAMTKEDVEAADAKSLISDIYENDDLGKTLHEPDRKDVLSHVDKLMPSADKAKELSDIAPAAAAGSIATDNKISGDIVRTESEAIKQAALEREQESTRSLPSPRPPQEGKRLAHTDMTYVPAGRRNADDLDKEMQERKFISMPFPPEESKLDFQMQKTLERQILAVMKNNPERRLQIQAFAAGNEEDGIAAGARRMSLSRALAVREYLMAGGIDSRRIDVRALGARTKRTPVDRVDLVFFENGAGDQEEKEQR